VRLRESCLELAWAQWVALGVSGSAPKPRHAVDLEAAIAFAPMIDELDPRLFDEVVDWCVRFAPRVVSVSRLKQVLKLFQHDHRARFERFAAIVNARGGAKWPTSAHVSRLAKLSNKSRFGIENAAAVQLRARLIFGIGARADVLLALLLSQQGWTRVGLLSSLAYTKRSLSDALSDLTAAGLLHGYQVGNALHHRLLRKEHLGGLLGAYPDRELQPWPQRLAFAAALLTTTAHTEGKSQMIRSIELRKVFEQHRRALAAVGDDPILGGEPEALVDSWLTPRLEP
jgi:hypothetical protein